jgi:hypothetical protein
MFIFLEKPFIKQRIGQFMTETLMLRDNMFIDSSKALSKKVFKLLKKFF